MKYRSDMVSLWCEFFVIFEAILPWKAHLAMLTLIWFLFGISSMWFFCKTLSAMLTLIWFLFGMIPYVHLLQNLFHNIHIEMVSFWYGFLCVENRINLNLYGMILKSRSYAYILCSRTSKVTKNDKSLNFTAKKLWLTKKTKNSTLFFVYCISVHSRIFLNRWSYLCNQSQNYEKSAKKIIKSHIFCFHQSENTSVDAY